MKFKKTLWHLMAKLLSFEVRKVKSQGHSEKIKIRDNELRENE
jgi:hypothetical protein